MKKNKIKIITLLSCIVLYCIVLYRYEIYGLLFSPRFREKIVNQFHRYDFPDVSNGWQKFGIHPVYGSDFTKSVFDPFVYKENENTFAMVLSERKYQSLVKITSFDGKLWSSPVTLLFPIENTWEHVVNRATIVKKDSVFHLFYTGQFEGVAKIGHAISLDGITYVRDKYNPVLSSNIHSEGVSVMNPCVIYNNSKECFQMWYAAGENYEPDAIFYAESNDGSYWSKFSTPVMMKDTTHIWESAKVGGCDVKIMPDNTYIMYYIGYQNTDVARICYATSLDGIKWERPIDNLLLSPTKGSWDSDAVYKPTVSTRNDTTFLWYNGRNGISERIGLAFKINK